MRGWKSVTLLKSCANISASAAFLSVLTLAGKPTTSALVGFVLVWDITAHLPSKHILGALTHTRQLHSSG